MYLPLKCLTRPAFGHLTWRPAGREGRASVLYALSEGPVTCSSCGDCSLFANGKLLRARERNVRPQILRNIGELGEWRTGSEEQWSREWSSMR